MNDYFNFSIELYNQLANMLLHSVWQIALVGLVFAIGRSIIRSLQMESEATFVYKWGCLCLMAMLLLPLGTLLTTYSTATTVSVVNQEHLPWSDQILNSENANPPEFANEGATVLVDLPHSNSNSPSNSTGTGVLWVTCLWGLGVLATLMRPLIGLFHLARLKETADHSSPAKIQRLGQQIADRIGAKRPIRFLRSSCIEVPLVFGMIKPVVLLPASMISGMTTKQIEHILAHEIAHIVRHDFLMNLVQTLVESLFFFHPVTWWVSHEIRKEREHCCDDIAVALTGDRHGYAEALAQLESIRVCPPLLAANGTNLVDRVRRITRQPQRRNHQWTVRCSLSAIAILVATVSFCLFTSQDLRAKSTSVLTVKVQEDDLVESDPQELPSSGSPQATRLPTSIDGDTHDKREALRAIMDTVADSVSSAEIEQYWADKASQFGISVARYKSIIIKNRFDNETETANQKLELMARNELLLRKLVADQKVTVTQEELRQRFVYEYGKRARALTIVCSDQKKAMKVWKMAASELTAENFSRLAKEYSEDERSSKAGGRIAPVPLNGTRPSIEQALFSVEAGELTPIVETEGKFAFFFSEGFTSPKETPDFDTVRDQLETSIREFKLRHLMEEKVKALSAGIGHAQPVDPQQEPAFITKSYAVADLVVPLRLPPIAYTHDGEKWHAQTRENKLEEPDATALMKLIKETIAPDSWETAGIRFFDPDLSLIVNQTNQVHDEIGEFVIQLRELTQTNIELRGFVIRVPKQKSDALQRRLSILNVEQDQIPNGDAKYNYLSAKATAGIGLVEIPRISLFNGQPITLKLQDFAKSKPISMNIQAVMSPDQSATRMTMVTHFDGRNNQKVFNLKQGRAGVIELTKSVGIESDELVFFVISPFIINDSNGMYF